MLGERDGEAVKMISQVLVETREAMEKAEDVLKEAMCDVEQAWDDVHGK